MVIAIVTFRLETTIEIMPVAAFVDNAPAVSDPGP
jgi:hypothetical protein